MNKVYVVLAILLIAVFVTSANGEVDSTERISNGFSYIVLEDGAVQITGYNPGISNVVIPSELDGRAVSSIGASAFAWTSIQSVEISEGITTIGNSAFAWCQNLSSISIPNSVTSIGDRAFYECRGIEDVVIPASVTSIGEEAFENCWQALFTVPSHRGRFFRVCPRCPKAASGLLPGSRII